jgi:hypothetical protein
MADGKGARIKGRANYQDGEYIFRMNDSAASTHDLEPKESGRTYLVHSTVARTINLPAPKAGVCYKFIVTDSTAGSTINAESTQLYGVFTDDNDSTNISGSTTVTIGTSAAAGDWLELISDGTYWFVKGQCQHASAGFTVS